MEKLDVKGSKYQKIPTSCSITSLFLCIMAKTQKTTGYHFRAIVAPPQAQTLSVVRCMPIRIRGDLKTLFTGSSVSKDWCRLEILSLWYQLLISSNDSDIPNPVISKLWPSNLPFLGIVSCDRCGRKSQVICKRHFTFCALPLLIHRYNGVCGQTVQLGLCRGPVRICTKSQNSLRNLP